MRKLFIIAIIMGSISTWAQEKTKNENCNTPSMNTTSEFNSAFAHTVYFWLKNPESQKDRKDFLRSLQKFLENSLYAKTCFIGSPPKASRDVVDGSFTYSLIVSFPSAEAQDLYQAEEAHKIFVEESADLWEKVIVYDSKVVKPAAR